MKQQQRRAPGHLQFPLCLPLHRDGQHTGIPDFLRPRVIIWYQNNCIACQNSESVFAAVTEAAQERGMTVHKVEATPELLQRFPHVTVVPLYDIVTPSSVCSAYGPQTSLRSLRNDLAALRSEFPSLKINSQQMNANVGIPPNVK